MRIRFYGAPVVRSLGLLKIFAMAHTSEAATINYTIGIHFGHTELSSAYYDSNSQIHIVTSIQSSFKWQEYFLATMEDPRNHVGYFDLENMAMFNETLESIVTATASTLGQSPDRLNISAFSVPQHFYDISSFTNMVETASRAGYIHRTGQVITHFNSARLAYDLDTCAAAGLAPGCNLDEEENYVFVVDYGKAYLSLGFAAVGKKLYAQSGERDWIEGEVVDETEDNRYILPPFTLEKIQDFLGSQLARREWDAPILPSRILAVILTGEASNDSMSAMKALLEEALPAFKHKFRTSIVPRLVGVLGAAHRARQMVIDDIFQGPERLSDHALTEEERNPRKPKSHDEL
ncbi:hypothetical protein ONS96_011022 [Cadophora gregata f. sp. sojae]|nr:hypothetical protein ONS96_011022 [Cadophora gregata f. sp. sojae]